MPALLAVAADPATRSPARLCCPGPSWDHQPATALLKGEGQDLAELEAVLAEVDGHRVVLQRRTRAQLDAEGQRLTRLSVVRRAVALLHSVAAS